MKAGVFITLVLVQALTESVWDLFRFSRGMVTQNMGTLF